MSDTCPKEWCCETDQLDLPQADSWTRSSLQVNRYCCWYLWGSPVSCRILHLTGTTRCTSAHAWTKGLVGAQIILLRHLNPPTLCNRTRLVVRQLLPHLIEATIITGNTTSSYQKYQSGHQISLSSSSGFSCLYVSAFQRRSTRLKGSPLKEHSIDWCTRRRR